MTTGYRKRDFATAVGVCRKYLESRVIFSSVESIVSSKDEEQFFYIIEQVYQLRKRENYPILKMDHSN
jgi:hypothetical protein